MSGANQRSYSAAASRSELDGEDQGASPAELGPAGWKAVLARTYREITDDRISLIAAGVAFYALLALFPAIAALISLAGLVFDPAQIVGQLQQWTATLPPSAAEIIQGQGESLASGGGSALSFGLIGGLVLSLYSASKGTKTLIEGMSVAYDVEETRGFLKLNLQAFGLTLLLILGLLLAAGLGVVLPLIMDALALPAGTDFLIDLARWLILALVVITGLSIFYQYGPNRPGVRWRWITPGAVLAVALLIAATALFSIYVGNFGNYNETYGTLGGVIVLLTWLWLSAYIVLVGAELNSELERQV